MNEEEKVVSRNKLEQDGEVVLFEGKPFSGVRIDSYENGMNLINICSSELNKIEPKLTKEVLKIFDLKYSVSSKKSFGGTSFDNIKKMINKYKRS